MRLRVLLAPLLALLAAGPLSAQDPAVSSAAPGDVIRLMVWRSPEFSGDFTIGPDGTILHPLLSDVRVAGVPPAQVQARIGEVLRQFESQPRFVFSLLHRVAVTGEVRLPGLYPLSSETTLSQAIAAAGGTSQFARPGRVWLTRSGQTSMIDLRRADALGGDQRIRPGDRLEVPRQSNVLRDVILPVSSVMGAVGAVITIVRH
jgi:polysaccharide biosynthesis/export protein